MACRYTYQGKTFEAHEFDDVLKSLPPAVAAKYIPSIKSTPDAPFIGKDPKPIISLALKRMIRYAVDGGFDRIAMVTGEQSAERYDLSKQVNSIAVPMVNADSRSVRIMSGDGQPIKLMVDNSGTVTGYGMSSDQFSGKSLGDVVGKELAEKIMSAEAGKVFSGVDLKVGGEGMKAFYDRIVPNVANDVLKKLGGGKVDSGSVSGGKIGWTVQDKSGRVLDGPFDDRNEAEAYAFSLEMNGDYGKVVSTKNATIQQPGFDITDKMREQAAQGMPLFQRGAEQQASFAASPAGKKRGGDAGVQRQVPGSSGSQARGAQQEVTGMDPRAVRGIVDLLTGGWKNAPKIEVIASMNDAPAAILRQYQIANDAGAQGEARGFLDRATGTVYVVASAARDAETVFSTVFHEALGHHGLRGVFGSALNKVLDDVAERRAADVARKAIEYGLLPEGVKATDGPHKIVAALPEDIRRDAAEEVLAEIAEKYPNIPAPGLIRRAIAAIRRWLVERFPTLRSIRTLTDADIIRDYIVPARDWVQRGREALTGGDGAVVFQRAYHGSPHKFDKFSLDKIGTGEGAQAYGYGLYFASKKEIAEHYRSTLAASTVSTQDGALGVNGLADALVKRAAPAPQLEAATHSKAVQIAIAIIVNGKSAAEVAADIRASRYAQTYSALADALEAMGADKTRGQLYTVDIPEDSEMLDWDKPLSEQPEGVRKAIKRRMPDMAPFNGLDMGSNATLLDNRDGQADQTSSQPWILRTQSNNGTSNFGLTQKDVDRMLGSRDVDDLKGQQIYTRLAAQKGSQQAASEYLNSMGIRGIKYLDGNSRTAKDGSHNYVIFDDKDVQITDTAFSRAKTEGMATKDVVGNQSGAPADDSMGGEYKIEHRPMQDAGGAARLHDLTASFPEDIYGSNALQYYGSGDQREASVLRILRSLRGKPDATVKIYRGAPASASGINTGDWVTLNRSVAQDYADQLNDGKVFEKEVKAKDVTAWGDSLLEYGYFPNESPTPNSSAFSREAGREARAAISAPSEHEGYGFAPTGGMQERAVRAEKSGSPEPAQKSKAAASEAKRTPITARMEADALAVANKEIARQSEYDVQQELESIQQNGRGYDVEKLIADNPKYWDAENEELTPEGYAELDRRNEQIARNNIGIREATSLADLDYVHQFAQADAFESLAQDLGASVHGNRSFSTSRYFEVTRADGKTAGFRFADHLNTSSQHNAPDFNIAPGGNTFKQAIDWLNESPTPDSSGVAFSRKLPATIEVDGQQRPTTYTTYRGVSHEGPNDYGVAGNGEYSSGRRQVAESYAGKDGKVESRTVTLNNPLSLTYAELNDLQTKLYGKPLTGFEKGLSDKFDAWLRSQGHDGVVLFDPEISKTVPEEVVRLADNADLASSGGVLFQRAKLIDQVSKVIQNEPTFNFLNKSLNTQAFKAWKSPEFRRVYDRVQTYIKDTARFAHESASLAPNLLPAWDRMLGVNGVLSGSAIKRDLTGQTARERRKVGAAVFAGTLNDKRTYTDAELRERFKLNEREIRMYREALTSAHASLDALAVSSLSKIASTVGVRQDVRGMDLLAAHEALSAAVEATKSKAAPQVLSDMDEVASRVADLKDEAYFPLMRFGDYTLTVRDKQGDVKLFRMYESKGARDTDLQAVRTDPEFKGMQVTTGTKANVANELYKGLSPDALEVFAKSIGASDQAVFQDYLRIAVANRSAMKRLIHRKGIAGFDEDVTRTLSNFITSNARLTSRNYHWAEALKDAAAIPQEKGDVADEAAKLLTYVADNKEEAGFIRNLMFVNFLGGSIASAALNATQPFVVTAPYLSQWGGGLEVGKALAVLTKTAPKSPELAAAMKRATEEGVIAPHEIHNLYAESDNGWMDRLHIPEGAQIGVRRGLLLWGAAFAAAESFNRQAAFIAGYSTYQNMTPEQKAALRDEGVSDAYKFAEKTVDDTQFVYNKGARPNWARGAVGATLFTFKTFTVSMLEVIGKASPKAKALIGAALILVAGIKGLPFEEDAEDIIDTIGQALGYRTNSGKEIELAAYKLLGQTLGGLLLHGVTGTGAAPFDVSQRMGMANIIPGTGVFLQSKDANAKMKEVAEAFGAFGGLVTQAMRMIDGIQSRGIGAGLAEGAPTAIANVIKAVDMADKGMYRDSKGRKVVDTTPMDAVVKAFGAQPAKVAKEQRALGMVADDAALIRNVTKDIVDKMARAQFDRMHATDAAKAALADKSMAEAEAEMTQWNKRNPEAGITIRGQDVAKRVQEMERDKELRTIKHAPRGMREDAMNTLQQLRQ